MGATLRPHQGPIETRISVNIFLVIQFFNLNMIKGFGAKIEGSWAKIRVSGVKIVALVPTAQNFLKLF